MRSTSDHARARLNFARLHVGGQEKRQSLLVRDATPAWRNFGGQARFAGVVFSFLLFLVLPNAAVSAGIHPDAVVAHTNAIRMRAGQSALRVDHALAAAAQHRAEELAAAAHFDHTRPDGAPFSTIVTASGYPFARVGENLAIDFLNEQPLVRAWMESEGHRVNLLNASHTHIGVGVATGTYHGVPTTVVVQLLGSTRAPAQRGWNRLPSALPIG